MFEESLTGSKELRYKWNLTKYDREPVINFPGSFFVPLTPPLDPFLIPYFHSVSRGLYVVETEGKEDGTSEDS